MCDGYYGGGGSKPRGLTSQEVEKSRRENGTNALTQLPPEPLWRKIIEGFNDPMIMILLVALAVQVVLWFLGETKWFEPVAILVAILIANGVASISENKQEGKAQALKAEELAKETAKVVREGRLAEIHTSEVVVGDVVYLQSGDKIPADGEIIQGALKVDQAALNGETEEAEKIPPSFGESYDTKDLLNKFYAYRGTVVCGGEAYMKVKVVGDATLFGALALEVQEEARETPLQVKLGKLAKQISTFGYIGAAAIVAGILLKTLISGSTPDTFLQWIRLLLDAITVAVTIIVCAVPEGLPMLTSILLSFQSLKMAKDNVLVRKINGLETAGSLSILFSDKTGTITEGRLSVTEMALGNAAVFKGLGAMPDSLQNDVLLGIGVNNSATASNGQIIGGNSTDRALMGFLVECGADKKLDKNRVERFDAFDSAKKYSSVTVAENGESSTFIKGAPEKIIEMCSHFVDEKGAVVAFGDKNRLLAYMDAQASRSMRLLAVAKAKNVSKSVSDEGESGAGDFVLLCVVSIRDNVRKTAAAAIREVQNAGIQVVMVTGDRLETATAIAKEAGLIANEGDLALTSSQMAEKSDEELKNLLPNLRVIARALPSDKSRLVRVAQEMNLVVGSERRWRE